MTLREEYKKETGMNALGKFMVGALEKDYIEWLEKKLRMSSYMTCQKCKFKDYERCTRYPSGDKDFPKVGQHQKICGEFRIKENQAEYER